jgi:hypothetical protein
MSENKTDAPSTTSEKSYSWVAGANFVQSMPLPTQHIPLHVTIFGNKHEN